MYIPQKLLADFSLSPVEWVTKGLQKVGISPELDREASPVFVLSTGRAGTRTLAAMIGLDSHVLCFHEPAPKLYAYARLAYLLGPAGASEESLVFALRQAREPLLRLSSLLRRTYVESSPQMTFLAPHLFHLLPNARFIHLIRDPRDVVCSGLNRGWFQQTAADATRIVPADDTEEALHWPAWSPLEKVAWLWRETNQWIIDFLAGVPATQQVQLFSEELFRGDTQTLKQLFETIGLRRPSERKVNRILRKKLNAGRNREGSGSNGDAADDSTGIWDIAGDLAEQFGYRP